MGKQKIEEQKSQNKLRVVAELGLRINADIDIKGFYNFSNAAQSSATGFSYETIGARLNYYIH